MGVTAANRSDEGITLESQLWNSLRWQFTLHYEITPLYSPTDAAPQFLETSFIRRDMFFTGGEGGGGKGGVGVF